MDRLIESCIVNIMILTEYCNLYYYPRDIIALIINYYHKLFKIKIESGDNYYMILFDGEVYSWGYNDFGQLGLNHCDCTTSPTKIIFPETENIKNIICYNYSSFAITKLNGVYAWGNNNCGQLGTKSYSDIVRLPEKLNLHDIKTISIGDNSTGIITNSGKIYVCGDNGDGKLGLGHKKDPRFFEKVKLDDIKKIICGPYHCGVLTNLDEFYTCGKNNNGQLGLGNNKSIRSFEKINLKNFSVKKISYGVYHCVALTYSNEIYVWGNNKCGQLGLGHYNNINSPQKLDLENVKDINCGHYYTAILTYDGRVFVCGTNKNYQLGLGDIIDERINTLHMLNLENIKKISCANSRIIMMTNSNEVYVCGCNVFGRLGLGHKNDVKIPEKLNLKNIKKIKYGISHFIALDYSNKIYEWKTGMDKPQLLKF